MTKHFLYMAGITLIAFSACQSGQKAASETQQQDSMPVTTATPVVEEATEVYYDAEIPAASSPGRSIGLDVKPNGDAKMTTDYNNYTPEIVQMGTWEMMPDSTILLSLVTVGSGVSKKDTMRFRREDDAMIYMGKKMGSEGLKLTKKDKPAPKDKELVMWVNKKKGTCSTGAGAPKECYQVAYGKMAPKKMSEWENFSEEIVGFDYKPGKLYHVKVLRKPRANPPQDVSMYSYELEEVISPK
jgi:hypothetical protein